MLSQLPKLREGNVFTCLSIPGGSYIDTTPLPGTILPGRTMGYVRQADGKYPTGMLFVYHIFYFS